MFYYIIKTLSFALRLLIVLTFLARCLMILKWRKIEKVPRGIQGEKSKKDMASLKNLVSTFGAQASPKKGGRNQVSGRVSVPCWHAKPFENVPLQYESI